MSFHAAYTEQVWDRCWRHALLCRCWLTARTSLDDCLHSRYYLKPSSLFSICLIPRTSCRCSCAVYSAYSFNMGRAASVLSSSQYFCGWPLLVPFVSFLLSLHPGENTTWYRGSVVGLDNMFASWRIWEEVSCCEGIIGLPAWIQT